MQQIHRHKYFFAILLFLIIGISITVFLSQRSTDLRQRAAGSASFTTPPNTYFPFGIFNEANLGPSAFPALATDLKAHNLDAIFYHNASANYVNQIGAAADAAGGIDIFVGPWQELTTQWYNNTTVTPDIATARSIVYPLVDQMGNHPSVKGYNVRDDVQNSQTLKNALVVQAINERDPSRPVLPTFLYNNDLPYPAIANQQVYFSYYYPAKIPNAYCDFSIKGNTTPGGNNFFQNIRRQRQLKQLDRDNTQFWLGLQTNGSTTNYDLTSTDYNGPRTPTVEELRMQVWQSLGEDIKGIFWFMYPTELYWVGLKDNPTLYPEVGALGGRIKPLKPTLLGMKKDYDEKFTATASTSLPLTNQPYVSTMKKLDGSRYYVIVNNASCSPQNISLATSAFSGGELKNLETNQTVALNTPISFPGGDGKIFELVNATLTKPAPTPAPNLLQNPGFEINSSGTPANWGARTGMSWDTTTAHSGIASMKLVGPTTFTYTPQAVPLKPNTQYALSYFVKTQNVTGKGVTARYLPTLPTTIYLPETDAENGTHDWKQIVTTFFTPPNMTNGRVDLIWYMNSGDTAWVDDIVLCEGGLGCNGTFSVPPLGQPPFPNTQTTPTSTSSLSPTPTQVANATPTPSQTSFPMPQTDPDYTKDIEAWWATHPFNPDNPNSIPVDAIQDPTPVVNVKTQFNGNIQAAIDSLPATGGTLLFDSGTYQHNNFKIVGKSNVHFVGNGMVTIVGGRSDTLDGGESTSGMITACSIAESYRSFSSAVNSGNTAALTCIKNPVRNFYFKNIIFDGGSIAYSALRLAVARDIVFDNVTFQNFKDTLVAHDGIVFGGQTISNIWFRNANFKGTQRYAIYLDGLHGGGVLNSRVEKQGVGGLLYLVNDDYTYDYDGDGQREIQEQGISNYIVIQGNSFATTNYALRASSANTLVKNNTIDGFSLAFVDFDRKNSPRGPAYQYTFYGNRVIGNTTKNLQYLVQFGQTACTNPAYACDKMGQYTVKDNRVQNAGSFIRLINALNGLVLDPPNVEQNNCVNGSIYGTGGPCTLSPTTSPIPTTQQPTATPSKTPTPAPAVPGDVNKDGRVDLLDFNIWRDEFLGTLATKQADLNGDGRVDLLDFNIWLTAYKSS